MRSWIRERRSGLADHGASAVEYGLLVAAIAALIVGVVFGLGGVVRNVFSTSCTSIGVPAAAVTREC